MDYFRHVTKDVEILLYVYNITKSAHRVHNYISELVNILYGFSVKTCFRIKADGLIKSFIVAIVKSFNTLYHPHISVVFVY